MTLPLRSASKAFARFSPEWWESMTTYNPETGCLTWSGFADKHGYCRTWFNGKGGVLAHRVAYECFYGPFDPSLRVCHACDNPRCVHPHHLFLGTQRENLRDMFAKGRARPHGWAKGEIEQRVTALFASHPDMTQRELAAAAGTSPLTVSKIFKAKGLRTKHARGKPTLASPALPSPALASENSNAGVAIGYGLHLIGPEETPTADIAPWRHVIGVPPVRPTQAVTLYKRPTEWTDNRQPESSVAGCCADTAPPAPSVSARLRAGLRRRDGQ